MMLTRSSRLLAALVPVILACTATYADDTSTQCRTEEDCRARGAGWENTTCTVDRVCVPVPSEAVDCSTSQECTDKYGSNTNPYRCHSKKHKCVPILSPECARIHGEAAEYLNDNAVFAMVSYPPNAGGPPVPFGAALARHEINQALGGGLPPVDPNASPDDPSKKRPLVVVECNVEPLPNIGSMNDMIRATRHMVDDVEVKMVVPSISQVLTSIAPEVVIPRQTTTLVSPSSATPAYVAGYEDKDTVFQLGGRDTDPGALLTPMMTQVLEKRVRDEGIAKPGEAIRVAIVYADDAAVGNTAKYILQNLKWEGKTLSEHQAAQDGTYLTINLGDTNDKVSNPAVSAKTARAITDVKNFKAHIVVMPLGPGFPNSFMGPLDNSWIPATFGPRPLYVSTLTAWRDTIIPALITNNANGLRKRYYGLEPVSSTFDADRFGAFELQLKEMFKELANQEIRQAAVNAYDAMYMLTYAVVASGATELTGPTIAKGYRRLGDGPDIQTGQLDLLKGIGAIKAGGNIRLKGVTGDMTFDEHGDRIPVGDAQLFCVDANGANVPQKVVVPGYRLNAKTQTTTDPATAVCP
jgi:hypothetical protein